MTQLLLTSLGSSKMLSCRSLMDPATSVWSLHPKLCRQRKSGFQRDLAWLGQQFSTAAVRSWGSCMVLFQVVLS